MRLTAVASRLLLLAAAAGGAISVRAMDVSKLWDFSQPAASEARFVAALAGTSFDEQLILKTQIARTYGLRGDFAHARELLKGIESDVATAGPEARARHAIETGRTYVSAAHPSQSLTAEARDTAAKFFTAAIDQAKQARLDGLTIDALHMMAFVEQLPLDQLKWTLQALTVAEASDQTAGRDWRASLHNNAGIALHDLGRLDEALVHFRRQAELRAEAGNPARERVARWMVAWTLRGLGRSDETLSMQLQLAHELDRAGETDVYVYEELSTLYRARGDSSRATHYDGLRVKVAAR
jgi:tetratricopeptide (TPR) repeat protein